MNDIEHEWQYRLNEALALGRNPKRAEDEANEWLDEIKTDETPERRLPILRDR